MQELLIFVGSFVNGIRTPKMPVAEASAQFSPKYEVNVPEECRDSHMAQMQVIFGNVKLDKRLLRKAKYEDSFERDA